MPFGSKKVNKMSAPTPTEKRTINVTGYNRQLVLETKEIPYDFTPAENLETAMARLGNDPAVVVAALNEALEVQAQQAARATAGITIRKKDVLTFVAPYRNLPPFNKIADRKLQTAEICAKKLATSPAMVAALEELGAANSGPDSSDGE